MPRLKITPNPTYDPGHLGRLLSELGSGPVMNNGDGTVTTVLSNDQLAAYHRKGGSPHKVEVLPDVDPPSAGTGTAAAPEPSPAAAAPAPRRVPTLQEVMDGGYAEDAAKLIVRRETLLAEGKSPAEAYQQMVEEEKAAQTPAPDPQPDPQPDPDPGIIGGTNDAKVEPPVEEPAPAEPAPAEQPPADLPPAA